MSLALLVAAAAAIGYKAARWWVVSVPVVLGIIAAGVVTATGVSLHDTPLPFAVCMSTIAVASGTFAQRRLRAQVS